MSDVMMALFYQCFDFRIKTKQNIELDTLFILYIKSLLKVIKVKKNMYHVKQ